MRRVYRTIFNGGRASDSVRSRRAVDLSSANHGRVLPARTIGHVDAPAAEAIVGLQISISGWALDPEGIRAVEVRLDGMRFATRVGIPRSDVARMHPEYGDSEFAGFEFFGDFSPYPAALNTDRRRLTVVAIAADGRETVLARKSLIEPGALTRWEKVIPPGGRVFHLLPALSGASTHGVLGLDSRYTPYLSPTTRIGMTVPILYLRTTKGAQEDFAFDPDFDVSRRVGTRAVADDNLTGVLSAAIEKRLPVLLTLNGGVWADASCSAPEWDVNDWLEQDVANCQWNEKNEVMPDDFLKHPLAYHSPPEIARTLTLNVYASTVRHYKKRNLRQAARYIVDFMQGHPDLFVGVSVDPDTYVNPFFETRQWYDYNPNTLRQFREWLAGSGPYGAGPGVPDLAAYRRPKPLALADVRQIARRNFGQWEDVDPPRVFSTDPAHPFWKDPWVREWEIFRRHLVALHYEELSRWLTEAGIPSHHIWSAQGFMAPVAAPFAVRIDSPVRNFDSGGMSIEGSKPSQGHLGAIIYGESAGNTIPMENGKSLFATFSEIDPGFAIVEFNTADLRNPRKRPSYAMGYRAFRDLWNEGARFVSPMAWNGSDGIRAEEPGYDAHTAWRNTPLEDAACDFLLARAGLPLGSLLWTFGTPLHPDKDGWSAVGGKLSVAKGYLLLAPDQDGRMVLDSPRDLPARARDVETFIFGLPADADLRRVRILLRPHPHARCEVFADVSGIALDATAAGIAARCAADVRPARVDQWRVELSFGDASPRPLTRVAALSSRAG